MSIKVLFILKYRELYGECSYSNEGIKSGLYNSANYVSNALSDNNIEAKMVQVIDANFIDAEVASYKPTHVIIEAFWVIPDKFRELVRLHPSVKWIIRNHSEIPFLAGEGIALKWISEYLTVPNTYVASNSIRATIAIREMVSSKNIDSEYVIEHTPVLKNYFPLSEAVNSVALDKNVINIGLFGAIRPLKNHLLQAFAAISFANDMNKPLRLHINSNRIEMTTDSILKNLRALFDGTRHELVEHEWNNDQDSYQALIRTMDIGMQVAFSETFNIVAADFFNQNVPCVVSPEIFWVDKRAYADPVSITSMVEKLHYIYRGGKYNVIHKSKKNLNKYNVNSLQLWIQFLKTSL